MDLHAPHLDWVAVRPEVTLVVASIVVLLVGLVRHRSAQLLVPVGAIAGLLLAGWFTVDDFGARHASETAAGRAIGEWGGQVLVDSASNMVRVLVIVAGLATVLYAAWGRP